MTNLERIKNMSIEEMAGFLQKFCDKDWLNEQNTCIFCPLANGCGEDIGDWAEWLENEVKPNEQI